MNRNRNISKAVSETELEKYEYIMLGEDFTLILYLNIIGFFLFFFSLNP